MTASDITVCRCVNCGARQARRDAFAAAPGRPATRLRARLDDGTSDYLIVNYLDGEDAGQYTVDGGLVLRHQRDVIDYLAEQDPCWQFLYRTDSGWLHFACVDIL